MSTEGCTPVLIDQYGGLVTLVDRSDLRVGNSPDCSNVEFFPGGVRSRSGFVVHQTAGVGSQPSSLLAYTTVAGVRKLLVLCSGGDIVGGDVELAPAAIPLGDFAASTIGLGIGLQLRGTTAFGRAYFSLYGGFNTLAVAAQPIPSGGPFQYDGVSITPVSQAAPPAVFAVTSPAGGTMSAGRHDFVVLYETSTGYVTSPSPPVGTTFTLNDKADFTALPLGPGAIVKRIIFATPANSVSFFSLPRFAINDNTTTTASIDFTDAELLSGASLEDYIDSPRIPPVIGVEKYGRRLVYWGGADRLQSFFDADATTPTTPVVVGLTALDFDEQKLTLPVPWAATGAGGAVTTYYGAALQVYRITGDGATATRGQIDQVASNVALSGTYYIMAQHKYGLRLRVRQNFGAAPAGTLVVTLRVSSTNVPGSGTAIATFSLPASAASAEWDVLSSVSTTAVAGNYAYVNMTVVASGTPTNGGIYDIDYIDVFDATLPRSGSVLWITPPDSPETLNLATGVATVAEDDGQEIRDVFELRGNLYVVKEHSLYVLTDNGDDPVNWPVDQVSSTIGTLSPHGVALGDGWATILDRSGLYYFTGGVPEKMSQEIQPTWDALRWGWGARSWIVNDPAARRVYIGVPSTGLSVTTLYVLDYVEGFTDPIGGGGSGRKWTAWSIAIPGGSNIDSGVMVEREGLTSKLFVTYHEDLMTQSAAALADVTTPIASAYESAPIGTEIGRSLFDRVVLRIRGSGSLTTQSRTPGGTLTTLPAKTLSTAPDDDIEIRMHSIQTQVGFRVGTSGATDFWSLRRLGVFIKPSEYTVLRKT